MNNIKKLIIDEKVELLDSVLFEFSEKFVDKNGYMEGWFDEVEFTSFIHNKIKQVQK